MVDQEALLKKFIQEFLPAQANQRNSKGNELYNIYSTLYPLFRQRFAISISPKEVLEAFTSLSYDVNMKPWKEGKTVVLWDHPFGRDGYAGREIYEEQKVSKIHINVAVADLENLRRCRAKLPAHTNPEKIQEREVLLERLSDFQNSNREGNKPLY